jgi:hypothetical protein
MTFVDCVEDSRDDGDGIFILKFGMIGKKFQSLNTEGRNKRG